jgi:mono/diheme cytochrome c family protein
VKVPILLKIGLLTVGATAFYTYVGQLVPQKEVQPPEEMQMAADMTTADLVGAGKELFDGKGMCLTCHTIGRSGALRFPDLGGIGSRAGQRVSGLDDVGYLAQSLYHPEAFIVPGFNPGMPVINKPPIALSDQEIRAVIAYLQSLGGTPTVTMQSAIPFAGGAAPAAGEAVAAVQAEGAEAAAAAAVPAVAAVATGPRDAQRLLDDYQCASCHRLDAPGRLQASSLADIGSRMAEPQIAGALAAHPPFAAGADFAQAVNVAELRALARYLSTLRGTGA